MSSFRNSENDDWNCHINEDSHRDMDGPIFVLFLIIQIIYLINSYSRSTNLKEVVKDIKKRQDMLDQLVNILQELQRKRALEPGESVITQITYEPVIEEDNTKLEEELGLDDLEKDLKGLVNIEVQVDLGLENMAELEAAEREAIEAKERQRLLDLEREEELARMEARIREKLAGQKLEADTDGARSLLEKVENFLTCITTNKNGLSAIRNKDLEEIRKIKNEIEDSDFINLLRSEYPNSEIARQLADNLENLHGRTAELLRKLEDLVRMRQEIEKMKQSTIAEIKSFSDPPKEVFQVMKAVYILLGENADSLKKWANVRILLGKTGARSLRRRILEFDSNRLKGEFQIIKKVKTLCKEQTLADVQDVSVGAAVFFSWCMVTIDSLDIGL